MPPPTPSEPAAATSGEELLFMLDHFLDFSDDSCFTVQIGEWRYVIPPGSLHANLIKAVLRDFYFVEVKERNGGDE